MRPGARSGSLCFGFDSSRPSYKLRSPTERHWKQQWLKADAMLDKGDLDGAAVWRQIVAAVNDLQREEPGPGERRH